MATQLEAINYIKSNYRHDVLDNGILKLIFNLDGGRSQLVFADVTDVNIQYLSPFASIDEVTPKQALDANSKYSIGMQLVGNQYMIKHVAFLADLDASEITEGFSLVAIIADELENQLVGGDKL